MAGEPPIRNLSGTRAHSVKDLMYVRDLLGVRSCRMAMRKEIEIGERARGNLSFSPYHLLRTTPDDAGDVGEQLGGIALAIEALIIALRTLDRMIHQIVCGLMVVKVTGGAIESVGPCQGARTSEQQVDIGVRGAQIPVIAGGKGRSRVHSNSALPGRARLLRRHLPVPTPPQLLRAF